MKGVEWDKCPNRTEIPIAFAKMEKEIEHIGKEQKEMKIMIKQNHLNLDTKFDKFIFEIQSQFKEHEVREVENTKKLVKDMDEKYASKYVEKVFWWSLSVVGTLLLTALVLLVMK